MSLRQPFVRQFIRSKIFRRQFSTIFALIVGFTLLFSATIALRTKAELEQRQRVLAERYRDQLAAALHEWLDSRINAVEAVAALLEGESQSTLGSSETTKRLVKTVGAYADFVDILLIDSKGMVINSSWLSILSRPVSVTDREYFKEAIQTGIGITGFFQAKQFNRPFMTVAGRLTTAEGAYAVAAAVITPDRFRTVLDSLNQGGPGMAYLVDNQSRSILSRAAHSETSVQPEAYGGRETNPAAEAAARGEEGVAKYRTSDGSETIGAYTWIEDIRAGLVVELDDDLLMKPLERLQGFVVILTAACLVLALIASSLLSLRISGPVRELIHAMDEVAASDYSRNVELSTGDEFDKLIERFNHMRRLIAKRESILKDDASRDSLTGLYNHAAIMEYLERAAASGGGVCFAMVDLDHFKRINDEHGHLAGDYVLTNLAELLKRTVRAGDFVGRYGGEEFAIVMRSGDEAAFCERLRVAIENTQFVFEGTRIPVTASVGWACSEPGTRPDGGNRADKMVNAADAALYRAKAAGRNRVERG